jgi:uncharacterized membrane protein
MGRIRELLIVFFTGAIVYGFIETVFRGYTHWTMLLTGGACLMLFYVINFTLKSNSMIIRCFISMMIITIFEFIVGYFVNIVFKLNVWDYSRQKFNFMGQICLLYSAIWFIFGIPMTFVSNFIKSSNINIKRNSIEAG